MRGKVKFFKNIILPVLFIAVLFIGCKDPLSNDNLSSDPGKVSKLIFVDEDGNQGEVSGHVVIGKADNETNVVKYLLYWGSATSKFIGDPLFEKDKNGSDLIYFFNDNTAIPEGAVYLLACSKTSSGELTSPVYVEISDNIKYPVLSVYDIQDISSSDHPADGKGVFVKNVIVTAVKNNGSFWVQEPDAGDPVYAGIYIYNPVAAGISAPMVGNVVTLQGMYQEFYGLSEIVIDDLIVIDTSGTIITPFEVTPSDIATGGSKAELYEGVLVKILNVTVTNGTPDDPDSGEFIVTGGLRVDDAIYVPVPDPLTNGTFSSVTGVLNYEYGESKLLPRNSSDVQQ